MAKGFYQDELSRDPGTRAVTSAPLPAPPGRAKTAKAVPGRGLATLLHLLVIVGGPLGLGLHVLMLFVVGRHSAPLVHDTSSAILRFAAQLVVLFGAGLALTLTGHTDVAMIPLSLMGGAYLVLPLIAAIQTWRTGRVFR